MDRVRTARMNDESFIVSAVLCTLNEEANIERVLRSLESQPVHEVILVDGGSSDRTVELARHVHPGVRVVQRPAEGLLRQRLWGIQEARGGLLLLLDADDELERGSVAAAIEHLERRGLDGSQFGFGIDPATFWSRRWSEMLVVSSPDGQRLPMIGRPALLRASLFVDLQPELAPIRHLKGEDSFIWALQRQAGLNPIYEAGPGKTVRLQPMTCEDVVQKAWQYGVGDAMRVQRFGAFAETYFHLMVRYPIVRGARALMAYGPATTVLCFLVGLVRTVSCTFTLMTKKR